MESTKPKKGVKQKSEKSFSNGAMTASIYLDQAPSGYRYPTVKLHRNWKAQGTGKSLQSDRFFVENEEDAISAIREACLYAKNMEFSRDSK